MINDQVRGTSCTGSGVTSSTSNGTFDATSDTFSRWRRGHGRHKRDEPLGLEPCLRRRPPRQHAGGSPQLRGARRHNHERLWHLREHRNRGADYGGVRHSRRVAQGSLELYRGRVQGDDVHGVRQPVEQPDRLRWRVPPRQVAGKESAVVVSGRRRRGGVTFVPVPHHERGAAEEELPRLARRHLGVRGGERDDRNLQALVNACGWAATAAIAAAAPSITAA